MTKVWSRPSVKRTWALAGLLVEKEMRTWVLEMGVIKGAVRMSPALTRDSWEVPSCLVMVGMTAMAVKTINKGMMTAKADFRGMPQSL